MAVWKRLGCTQRNQRTWWQIVVTPYKGLALYIEARGEVDNILLEVWLSTLETLIKGRYLEHFLWYCPQVNATRPHWWSVNISLGNGLVLSGNKPLWLPLKCSLGFAGGKHYQKITIPIFRLLQNFAIPGCFPYILFYRYILSLLSSDWLLLWYVALFQSGN